MIFEKDNLTIRQLNESDTPFLSKWLSDPDVLQYYEGRDKPFNEEKVRSVFLNKDEAVQMCIVSFNEQEIGYIQFYKLDDESKKEYGYENSTETLFGMDQFIGEIDFWNRGIGRLLVSSTVDYLVNHLKADKVVMDPQTWNSRAISCYEKCGFKRVKLLPKHEWHEGEYRDCYVMEYDAIYSK